MAHNVKASKAFKGKAMYSHREEEEPLNLREEDEEEDEDAEEDEEEDEDSDDQDEEEEEGEKEPDPESLAIKEDLSKMPMAELLKLKERLGKKVYGSVVFGAKGTEGRRGWKERNADFKRANKNRPREMSSKRPAFTSHEVFVVKKAEVTRRDPRFEPTSGEFNEKIFNKSYSFLNEVKEKEKKTLKKQLKKEADPGKKGQLEYLVKRMDNQAKSDKDRADHLDRLKKLKLQRKEQTGKPFVNKSELKKVELVEKFKKLQKSGKLDKYLEKKRKKNASKERKKLNI